MTVNPELGKKFTRTTRGFATAAMASTLAMLAACNMGNGSSSKQDTADPTNTASSTGTSGTSAAQPASTPPVSATPVSATPPAANTPTTSANAAPQISGNPGTTVSVGASFSFQPAVTDANGDTLSLTIENKPSWATFSITTGNLSGTPTAADVGSFANIIIRVSDGNSTTALAAFSVDVRAATQVARTATLRWVPPTLNTDGSSLTDLAGYYVYYGPSANNLTRTQQIPDSRTTSYTVNNLTTGTYFFAISAYTATGTESDLSATGSKTFL
jgi:hypothetical protein